MGSIKTFPKEVCSDCWSYADSGPVDNWLGGSFCKGSGLSKLESGSSGSLKFVCEGPETK